MYGYANAKYKSLAQDLVDADPIALGHIDVSTIAFLTKEEKAPKKAIRIEMIREPYVMMTNKTHIVIISEVLVDDMSRNHLELHMYKVLKQINKEGRIIPPDVVEFSDIIDLFGYDWQERELVDSIIDKLEAKTVADVLADGAETEKVS